MIVVYFKMLICDIVIYCGKIDICLYNVYFRLMKDIELFIVNFVFFLSLMLEMSYIINVKYFVLVMF